MARGFRCDGCNVPNDGDVFEQYDALEGLAGSYGNIKPENRRELMLFWLCGECREYYPNGARDFFVADFFDTEPYCAECEVDEVEEWGHLCDYCMEDEEVLV